MVMMKICKAKARPMELTRREFLQVTAGALLGQPLTPLAATNPLRITVDLDEDVYQFRQANNGAGPMWCRGSTCLVRIKDHVFVSGLETLKDVQPLNNCRWVLYRRDKSGWRTISTDPDRTREPAPIAGFASGPLFLSANPSISKDPKDNKAEPQLLQIDVASEPVGIRKLVPEWGGKPAFLSHSYRSFASDGSRRELILFQNTGYSLPDWGHAEWTFRDSNAQWAAKGQLKWPWGKDYEVPQPIRVCYPTVALKDRAVHFCGVSDITEPRSAWRAHKRTLTGQEWDYDLRRMFYTSCADITRESFQGWIEVASCEEHGGQILPGDLWIAPDKSVHVVWSERLIDERLKPKFFPNITQLHSIKYAVIRDGKVQVRQSLVEGGEGKAAESPSSPRFQITADNRLFLVWFVRPLAPGKSNGENRIAEIRNARFASDPVTLPLRRPFTAFFTATPRAGSPQSSTLEMLGSPLGAESTISYARVQLLL
jgi:hypothetical protein